MVGSPPLPQRTCCPVLLALLVLCLGLRCVAANSSTTSLAVSTQQPSCRVSQFFCNTGQCVALDRYCDGEDDCGDKSDEPRYCSPCNRTYFGDVGRTYELEIRRPREDRLPFVCHLNFTAIGGQWGDLVQLTFDTFTVGKFVSFTSEGCPHGHMSIAESGLPATGGQWCGSAWGYTVYFSESRSLNLSLILTRLSEQGIGYTFDFKLNYRFLKRSEAALRYGISGDVHRGILIPGSYCDRVFTRCDVRKCRLQSPNFPGVYPRNVTCRYVIMQHRVPEGSHATITVRQPDSRRVHVKDRIVQYDRSQRVLRLGDQCNVIQDHLTVYDGFIPDSRRSEALLEAMANKEASLPRTKRGSGSRKRVRPSQHQEDDTATDNARLEVAGKGPVLARLCGGDAVPDIVSSGPRMLVEFSTSPFDSPFHPAPLSYLPGFELDIQIRMVASTPPRFYTQQGRCVFTVSSFESRQGQLGPPQHSLPANTTCRYEFAGRPTERVWVAFMKYHVAERTGAKPGTGLGGAGRSPAIRTDDFGGGDDERGEGSEQPEEDDDCAARLRIWDGRPPLQPHLQDNSSRLLGEFCRDESPRLCDHSLLSNSTRFPRPCAPGESYLSSGPTFTLEQHLRYGTALHPVSFVLRYEFVDVSQGGAPAPRTTPPYNMPTPTPPTWDCDREFRHSLNNPMSSEPESGTFRSPRAVFFYGRGGNANLTCLYHFQASRERLQSVRLTVKRARFGERKCVTRVDLDTGRKVCELRSKNGAVADLRFFELPWEGVVVARDCICDEVTPSRSVSIAGAPGASLLVNFTIIAMNVTQDFTDFYFEGEYTFLVPDKNVHSLANTINGPCPRNSVLNPEGQKLRGSSGDLTLRSPNVDIHSSAPTSLALSGSYEDECQNYPWLIELEDPYNFLYMEVRGTEIVGGRGGDECRTRNRVVVHSAQSLNSPTVICPDETGASTVAIFSPGWKSALAGASQAPPREHDRSLVVEFLEREPGGPYALSWLEISRRPVVTNPTTGATKVRGEALSAGLLSRPEPLPDCPYKCPELNACIAPELWCDGTSHCPSGYDELESNCEVQSTSAILDLFGGSLFVVYLAAGTAALVGAVLLVLAAALTAAKLRKRAAAAAAAPGWRRGHNGVVSAPGLGPPIEAHKNGAARSRVDDLYGKDSLC